MDDEEQNKSHLKTISIRAKLYDQLRAYCDQKGIKFVDFIEEALESAAHLDHITEILGDEESLKEKIADEQRTSIRYGFRRGILAALLAVDGRLALSQDMIPPAVTEKVPFKTVSGGQLKLFD